MKVLAIGAHPDDIEIFMYGLLSVLKKEGNELHFIVATDGSLGGTDLNKNLKIIRANETKLALKNLGKLNLLGLPDGHLGDDISHTKILRENINSIKPDLVITHYKNDYHSDHRLLSKYVEEIAGHHVPVLFCDTLMGLNFNPDYYFDISNCFENKKRAILSHKSQKPKRFVELSKLMNSFRSAQCNAPKGHFAEAYSPSKNFPFTDFRDLLPDSIKVRSFYINTFNGFL